MDVITSESKHFAQGSSNIPKQDGLLRLYSMWLCPFAERARLVLLVKKLRHEIVNIDLKRKPDWFLELNPQGKVPALDTGSKIVVESLDVCDYLDETYPEPKLYPSDSNSKARDKELSKKFDKVIEAYYQTLSKVGNKTFAEYTEILLALLQEYEDELASRGNFFGGNEPAMLDYMVWPWAERAEIMEMVFEENMPIPDDKIPHIKAWCKKMRTLDVIKDTVVSKERAFKLLQLYQSGGPVDYDSVK